MERLILGLCFLGCLVQGRDIMDNLRLRHETTLIGLLQTAGLDTTLQGAGPFTVFAPSNTAFSLFGYSKLNALKSNPTALADLLKYHVVSGVVTWEDLQVNEKMLTSLAGPKIRVNNYMYTRHVATEGSRVMQHNITCDNGMIHIIEHVMMPPNGSITDIVATNPDLATLKTAIDKAGLTAALAEGPYTLFAPNERAFQALGDDTLQALLADPELLKSVLLYHVIHGTLYATGMHSGSLHTLEEVDNERLVASFGGRTASVDGSRVVTKDISATNGVIHVIDHVLIPASLKASLTTNP